MRLLIVTQKVDQRDPILGFFHRWLLEFAKQCESVIVICLEQGQHELPANVRVHSLGKEDHVSRFTYLYRFYLHIWHERKNYDAVFVHMNPIYVVLAGFVWKLLHKRVSLWYTHKSVDWKLKIAEKFVGTIFSASQESFRLPTPKVLVTGHGIDTDYYVADRSKRHSSGVIQLLTTGRVAPVKHIDLIIRSVHKLIDAGTHIELTIVGDGVTPQDAAYVIEVKKLVQELGIQSSVHFIGSVSPSEILPYLQRADFFINMSTTGSLDKALLEAMACEVVTVSSNEAFKDLLSPYGLFIQHATVEESVAVLERALASDARAIGTSLRAHILATHSLSHLIPLLISRI